MESMGLDVWCEELQVRMSGLRDEWGDDLRRLKRLEEARG